MQPKQMRVGPVPPDIEENPRSQVRLAELGLSRRTQRLLAEAGFETAGEVASRSAEEFRALLYFTPKIVSEIEESLARLGLALRGAGQGFDRCVQHGV